MLPPQIIATSSATIRKGLLSNQYMKKQEEVTAILKE